MDAAAIAAAVAAALRAMGANGGPRPQAKGKSVPGRKTPSKDVPSGKRKGVGPFWTCVSCGCEGNYATRAIDGLGCRACNAGADRLAVLRASCWNNGTPIPDALPTTKPALLDKDDAAASAEPPG